MITNRKMALTGNLTLRASHAPGPGLRWQLANRLRWGFITGWLAYHLAPILGRALGFMTGVSKLAIKVRWHDGTWTDYGVVSYRVVTTAFVTALATALHTQASPGNLFYHAFGVGTGNEAVGDTGMGTELTTEYNPDGTRPTGTHTSAAGVYESVATLTIDAGTPAVTEHGVMGAATGASTLIDRSKFAAINLIASDSIVATYDLTLTAGG
jgi:hypothetical protein